MENQEIIDTGISEILVVLHKLCAYILLVINSILFMASRFIFIAYMISHFFDVQSMILSKCNILLNFGGDVERTYDFQYSCNSSSFMKESLCKEI